MKPPLKPPAARAKNIAIIGAGMAGITGARTLANMGHTVHVFDKSRGFGGRMSTRHTPWGGFDHGAQYFTVRDARFKQALATTPNHVAAWTDAREGGVAMVAVPGMSGLVGAWAQPLARDTDGRHAVSLQTLVEQIEPDRVKKGAWQLRVAGADDAHLVQGGFDAVVLAVPSVQAHALLMMSGQPAMAKPLSKVKVAPNWTLMVAFAQAPGARAPLGPVWHAKRVTHPRLGWLARESAKPGRESVERWTVQANAAWSQEHLDDDAQTVQDKLLRAFAEVTGIHAEPTFAQAHRWRYAQTTKPLGQPFVWDAKQGLGVCGDWCLGHRVEDAFVSGLELALAMG
jgi:renalase